MTLPQSSFTLLSVRTGDEPTDPLYPVPGSNPNAVQEEADDGPYAQRQVHAALGLALHGHNGQGMERLVALRKVDIAVGVTAGRVIVACTKFTKGGSATPFGLAAVPLALTITAVSKARAAHQRKGKSLVGHVRYPWLVTVGYRATSSLAGDKGTVRLAVQDPTASSLRPMLLDLDLTRNTSAKQVAEAIAGRAATYCLETQSLEDGQRQHLETLSEVAATPADTPKGFATIILQPQLATASV